MSKAFVKEDGESGIDSQVEAEAPVPGGKKTATMVATASPVPNKYRTAKIFTDWATKLRT